VSNTPFSAPDPALLSRRERLAWLAGFVIIASLLVMARFESVDADSVRYATISAVLSTLPVARWVAPEWWGLSPDNPLSGYFLEHPAGLFFIPAALGKLGVPPNQAPYIFGVGAGLAALLLTAQLVGRLSGREAGRAALVLLQIMPVAFVFRIRDNHEYPMLVCLLITLAGLERMQRTRSAAAWVAVGVTAALLIKGVFVVLVLMAAALWIAINPMRASRRRQIVACVIAVVATAMVAVAYDYWYAQVTGGPFWRAYWSRQMAPLAVDSPFGQVQDFARHIGFYLVRLLFHPAPWSFALIWVAARRRALAPGPAESRRGLWFVLAFTAGSVLLLSLASRFAERYAFSASYLIGAAGAAAAYRYWLPVRHGLSRLEARVFALPVVVWVVLTGLRLGLGPWLPRLGS
jgi:4-amino-4-deoxy-L-arabinose transferase-like glycosyltransferase